MKTGKALATVCLMAVAAMEAEGRTTAGDCVTVNLQGEHLMSALVLAYAEATASRIFGDIGVSVRWIYSASRPAGENCVPIRLRFVTGAPATFHPGALAYALPYQEGGTQIQVFVDRVRCSSARQKGVLLGYVTTHEIGHVLEEVSWHSGEGIMKAHWADGEFTKIFAGSLRFVGADADLIHRGLSKRRELVALGSR